nr:polycomb group protein Psc-like [Rhipicephalus microplus]
MPGARLADLNSVITCMLCNGYLVDATTLIECLHSFCKVCIVQFLNTSLLCPICDVPVHQTKPHQSIRLDRTLQNIVYKVVPGLYQKEMKKRRDYYEKHPEHVAGVSCPEDRGIVDDSSRLIFSPDDTISLSLEYCGPLGKKEETPSGEKNEGKPTNPGKETEGGVPRRFLNCPAAFTINHLQKFIRMKYSVAPQYQVDIIYMDEVLSQEFALMDVAYIYAWKRDSPMRLFFRICKMPPKPSAVKGPPITACSEIKQMVENGTNSSTETEVAKEPAENKPADESRTAMPPPRAPEQENKPAAKTPPAPAGAVLKSVPQPEEPREPAVTAAPATEPSIATIAPAAEHHAPETPEMKTAAEEESTAPGSPKAIALVQSTSPQRQKASEPPAEAQSPPPLPKITISGLDKNSHKILIHTKEVSHTLGPALSPPQNGQDRSSPPYGKKSKRKEQHDIERHHQSKRKSPEKVDKRSQWCQSPQEDGISNKKLKLDGCDDAVEVDRKSISSPLQKSEGSVSISEAARRNMPKAMPILLKPAPPPPPPAHPRTPPYTPIPPSLPRSEKDTQPLDLSVTHRGTVVGVSQDPPRRPRGRPSVPLPSVMPLPLVTKRPSLPQTTTVTTTSYSPPTSVPTFHKMPAVPPTSSHHHHHHHHRGNSKSFRKNANLTCITPDPNAGHTKIVIRNMPPLNTNNNNLHRV